MYTIDDYRKGIREKYEKEREREDFELQANPTPADLRRYALWLLEEKDNAADLEILRRFFDLREGKEYRKQIEEFPLPQYRPIQSLFDGSKQSDKEKMLDLGALMADFQPRPFKRFRKAGQLSQEPDRIESATQTENTASREIPDPQNAPSKGPSIPPIVIISQESRGQDGTGHGYADLKETHPNVAARKTKEKWWVKYRRELLLGSYAATIFVGGAAALNWSASSPKCMQWQGDHYEAVDCETPKTDHEAQIVGMDTAQFRLRRIAVTDTTTFFRKGEPVVWYLKHDNMYECFDRKGYHPIMTDRELNPVSSHIADLLSSRQ